MLVGSGWWFHYNMRFPPRGGFAMDKNRLFWASRRGMLELDLVLQPFLEKIYPRLDKQDQRRYQQLLDCEDQELFNWFLRKSDPDDPDLLRIVEIIRDTRAETF